MRKRPFIYLDDLAEHTDTALVDVSTMVVHTDFIDTEVDDALAMARAKPGAELVISVHRSPAAAGQVLQRRKAQARWAAVELRTRVLPMPEPDTGRPKWTAVTIEAPA